jgi:hypothetical protein
MAVFFSDSMSQGQHVSNAETTIQSRLPITEDDSGQIYSILDPCGMSLIFDQVFYYNFCLVINSVLTFFCFDIIPVACQYCVFFCLLSHFNLSKCDSNNYFVFSFCFCRSKFLTHNILRLGYLFKCQTSASISRLKDITR